MGQNSSVTFTLLFNRLVDSHETTFNTKTSTVARSKMIPLALGLFVVFNCVLPFTDVLTDGITFTNLLYNGHVNWAGATFYFMWNAFILHLLTFFYNVVQAWWEKDEVFDWRAELKKVCLHIPFMAQIKNLFNAYRLFEFGFGSNDLEADWEQVEKIQHEADMVTKWFSKNDMVCSSEKT